MNGYSNWKRKQKEKRTDFRLSSQNVIQDRKKKEEQRNRKNIKGQIKEYV